MSVAKNLPACQQVRLDVLLFGDETSAHYEASARHVESCPACRERLTSLAADDDGWAEASALLNSESTWAVSESMEFATQSKLGASKKAPRIGLDFLAPAAHPELLGRLGRYDIEQVIGSGGMGIVLKGFDTELNRPVAVKVLAPHLAHSGAARQRFAREARAAASIVHEHVVAIHDVDSRDEAPYLVMQYVAGRSLDERVRQEGPLAADEILRLGMQAAAALAAAHEQGVIHRDVKPANILLERGVERVLLTDFGLARAADDATLTHSGIVAGTPHYMSPEQARGGLADERSDLFALGAVLYFMATGHPPFRAEQAMAILHRICHDPHRGVQEINPAIPDGLADVIDCLLEKKPGRRFATAGALQQVLARQLSSSRHRTPSRWGRWLRRQRRRPWPLVGVVGMLVAVTGIVWWAARPRVDDNVVRAPAAEVTTNPSFLAPEDLAAWLRSEQAEFARELAETAQALEQMESRAYANSLPVETGSDAWPVEMGEAAAALDQLERQWLVGERNSSTSNP